MLTMDKGDMGGQAANNSSDFVRKLYKMLEDPSYDSIVRWGEGGESFVVLENEKFTKNILPKHFKHSNFASFVRQLNKYDFHKVRQNNEDSTPSPYGPNAWEFKHPEFQANKKDSLDNIRRKAPAQRKATQVSDEGGGYPAQQMDLVNSQLIATQQQLQQLSERYNELSQGHVVLLQQVFQLQKFVKNHDGVMHRVMGFLHSVDAQRRNSNLMGGQFGNSTGPGMNSLLNAEDDHPASPLQQASKLLDEFSAENLPNKELEQMTHNYHMRNDYCTPPHDPSGGLPTKIEGSTAHAGYAGGNDLDNMVYPVGQTNGIDPVNSKHINNIPYSLPSSSMMPMGTMPPDLIPHQGTPELAGRKRSHVESVWGITKPRILLVEDDNVCARIGSKFLQAFECSVETAGDGFEAMQKIDQDTQHFDLIFMDIIMPHLDGVSATVCIREIRPSVPIIAMTSNIRADDIDMYFRYGMNDVLPKPFTKDGMLRTLEKHLPQFKKGATFSTGHPQPVGYVSANQLSAAANQTHPPLGLNMGQLSASQSIKDETSPGKSPATVSSWHSPSQIPIQSPIGTSPANYMQQPSMRESPYGMAPQPGFHGGPNPVMAAPRSQAHRRVMSDISGGPPPEEQPDSKRQRMYPTVPGNFVQ